MLNVTAMSSAGGVAQYLHDEGDNYYVNSAEAAGQWHGKAAAALGLYGDIDRESFENILRGFSADGKEKLCQNAGENHRAGWDMTFSAPKSVSSLAALVDDSMREKIEKAHQDAVDVALDHAEKLTLTRRGKSGKNLTTEKVGGVVVGKFLHGTSRADEPNLHTHGFLANVALRDDGTTGTVFADDLYDNEVAIGHVYQAKLGQNLRALGIEIARDEQKRAIKITSVPAKICEEFSSRRAAIKKIADEKGLTSAKALEKIAVGTREKKSHDKSKYELQNDWIDRASAHGFSPAMARKIFGEIEPPAPEPINLDAVMKRVLDMSATFTDPDLWVAVCAEAQLAGAGYDEIVGAVDAVKAREQVVQIGLGKRRKPVYSTRDQIDYEVGLVSAARKMSTDITHDLLESDIDAATKAVEDRAGYAFSSEQRDYISHICKKSYAIGQGSAGAGKTSAVAVAHAAYVAAGYTVLGSANSSRGAVELGRDLGIKCDTNAGLIGKLDTRKVILPAKSLVIIDEGGMASTHELESLRRHVAAAGGKIILTGEDKQYDAVAHGGGLRTLTKEIGAARIETIIRQDDSWNRNAITALRDGRAGEAVSAYEDRDLLHFEQDVDAVKTKLVDDWYKYHRSNPAKDSVIITQQNRDVKALSEEIRAIRKSEGLVADEDVKIKCSASGKNYSYEFSTGDRVKFCKNDARGLGVINGTTGTITAISSLGDDAQITVKTDDRGEITFRSSDYLDQETGRTPMILGYAMTGHASQGMTVKGQAFVMQTGMAGRAGTYVPASRATGDTNFYMSQHEFSNRARNRLGDDHVVTRQDLLDELARTMNIDNRKRMAIEYLAETDEKNITVQAQQAQQQQQHNQEIEK